MKNNYQVIDVFDSDAEYTARPYPPRDQLIAPQKLMRHYRFTPNAPIKAKDTLLAQCLRSKMPIEQIYYGGNIHVRDLIKNWRRTKNMELPARKKDILERRELIGKIIGIEIEYYPQVKLKESMLTHPHRDGSLDEGGEEVSRLTWTSKSGRLEGLLALNIKGRVNKKCGLHVHIDARHIYGNDSFFSPEETYDRIIELSKFLKKLVPKSRLTNDYCEWVNNRHGSPNFICPRRGERYAAINWCAYKKYNTIEFRCQGGTLNKIKIESWALLCQFIVNFCAQRTNELPQTWREFLEILPEPIKSWCFLRKESLYGAQIEVSERALSALEN